MIIILQKRKRVRNEILTHRQQQHWTKCKIGKKDYVRWLSAFFDPNEYVVNARLTIGKGRATYRGLYNKNTRKTFLNKCLRAITIH